MLVGLQDSDAIFLISVISRMLLHNACGLERRIVKPLQSWPFKLLWLAFKPMTQKCTKRMGVASELLSTDCEQLEINARKIKKRFAQELGETAQTGCIHPRLYWLFKSVALIWKADVRENERLNKMIGLLDDRCPQIGMDLKSSRVSIKYKLGAACAGITGTAKWSQVRPKVENLRAECLESWPDIVDVMSNPTRWSPTSKPPDVPTAADVKSDFPKLKPDPPREFRCLTVR